MPRKFAPPKSQTSLVLLNLVTHLQSPGCGGRVWFMTQKNDIPESTTPFPKAIGIPWSSCKNVEAPRVQEWYSSYRLQSFPEFARSLSRSIFFFYAPPNDNIKHKSFCLSFLTLLLSEVGLGPLIPLTSDDSIMGVRNIQLIYSLRILIQFLTSGY